MEPIGYYLMSLNNIRLMEPQTLNNTALLITALTGVLWIGFGFTGNVLLLFVGLVTYFIGMTAFISFVVAKIAEYINESSIATSQPRAGGV